MAPMETREAPEQRLWVHGTESEAVARPLTPRAVHRAALDSGVLPFAFRLWVFVALPVTFAWVDAAGAGADVVAALMLVYGLAFVYCAGIALYPQKVRLAWFALCTQLLLGLIPVLGPDVLYMVMFQA